MTIRAQGIRSSKSSLISRATTVFAMMMLLVSPCRAWGLAGRRGGLSAARILQPRRQLAATTRLYNSNPPSGATLTTTTSSSSSNDTEPIKIPKKFVPFPFQYHEELTLRVDALTNLGMGICRTPVEVVTNEEDDDDASTTNTTWVIFVPNTIPGELVQLRVYRNYKSYSDADLVQIIESSPDRVEPSCPLATKCGGCQYQHINIDAQRHWKTEQVREVLERIGGFDDSDTIDVTPTLGTDEIWNYRSKITPHYEKPKKLSEGSYEIREIGFKRKSSRQLVDVEQCLIATEAINEKLTQVRQERREAALTGDLRRPKRGATLLLRDAEEGVVTDHNEYVTQIVGGKTFRFLAGNFFQNNPFVLPLMVQHVLEAATQKSSLPLTHLIDTYCGSGLFCISASSLFDTCVGIEVNDKAIAEATENANLNDCSDNCKFVAASAEAIFESEDVQDFPRDQTVVICDPPRKGCSEEYLAQLFSFRPQRLVYMSCDVATQARDAKLICAAGYDMTSIQPFDLFPQTRHIECLIVFEKKATV